MARSGFGKCRQEGPGQDCGPKEGILALALTADGKKALVASGSVCILYDLESKKELLRLAGHTAAVNALAFSPDGSRILTGSVDRTVRLWEANTGKELRKIEAHAGYVKAVQFTADGLTAASVGYDHVNRLWDLRNGQMITSYEVHNRPALSVVFSPMARRSSPAAPTSMSFVGAGPRLPQASEAAPTGIALASDGRAGEID